MSNGIDMGKNIDPRTEFPGNPRVMSVVVDSGPLTTSLCILLHDQPSLHLSLFSVMLGIIWFSL